MRVVLSDGWCKDSAATQTQAYVGVNLDASLGPAPGGYLMMSGVEVFITLQELRTLWDAWIQHSLPTAP
jgi:hypothetical protein